MGSAVKSVVRRRPLGDREPPRIGNICLSHATFGPLTHAPLRGGRARPAEVDRPVAKTWVARFYMRNVFACFRKNPLRGSGVCETMALKKKTQPIPSFRRAAGDVTVEAARNGRWMQEPKANRF